MPRTTSKQAMIRCPAAPTSWAGTAVPPAYSASSAFRPPQFVDLGQLAGWIENQPWAGGSGGGGGGDGVGGGGLGDCKGFLCTGGGGIPDPKDWLDPVGKWFRDFWANWQWIFWVIVGLIALGVVIKIVTVVKFFF